MSKFKIWLFCFISSIVCSSYLLAATIPLEMNKYPTRFASYSLQEYQENGLINISSRIGLSLDKVPLLLTASFVVAPEDIEVLYNHQ
jgi:hypothetical protein